jgi:hypothetical protein
MPLAGRSRPTPRRTRGFHVRQRVLLLNNPSCGTRTESESNRYRRLFVHHLLEAQARASDRKEVVCQRLP